MTETDLKKSDSLKEEKPQEERIQIDEIFIPSDINEIWNSKTPINLVAEIIETFIRKTTGDIEMDPQLILATAEFHINNLIFLKEKFLLTSTAYAKLLNLLAILLKMTDGERSEDVKMANLDLLIKLKLKEIKIGLIQQDLLLISSSESHGKGEALKPSDIFLVLDYLNNSFFNFIQLYYFFANVQRKEEDEKIEVIINKPLSTPSLSKANKIEKPKEKVEEKKEEKQEVRIVLILGS